MSQHDVKITLVQISDYVTETLDMVEGCSRDEFRGNRMMSLAVIRLLEVVGEAANRLPADFRAKHTSIPWRAIINMRNKLIHGYDNVDLDVLWSILTQDFPNLREELKKIS